MLCVLSSEPEAMSKMLSPNKGQNNASIFSGLDDPNRSDTRLSRRTLPTSNTKRKFYDKTCSLLVSWELDEVKANVGLQNTLQQHYLADCEQLMLSGGDAAQTVFEEGLRQLSRRARAGHNLLVILYAGSSEVMDGQLVLKSRNITRSTSIVKWKPLLEILKKQASDVLLILDCAYWTDESFLPFMGSMEILAASEGTVTSVNETSQNLSSSIEQVLHNSKGAPISVIELVEQLAATGSITKPCHEVLSQSGKSEIKFALPAGKDHLTHPSTGRPERSGLLKLRHTFSSPAQSKIAINNWLDSTISLGTSVSRDTKIGEHTAEVEFRAQESIALNPVYWQQVVQSRPAMVSHAEVELNQPPELDSEQLVSCTDTVNTLVENLQLNKAIQRVLPNKYTQVLVIPIMWENIEKDREQDIDLEEVRAVFCNEYNYEVDKIYRIKSNKYALMELKAHINQKLIDNKGTCLLLITVYGGHGKNSKREGTGSRPLMLTDTAAGKWDLDWSSVQSDLDQAHCDTLAIMNCCYGGNAALGEVNGTNEILSAVDRDTETYTLDQSFLRVLSKELKEAAQEGGTNISDLHQKLDKYNMRDKNIIKAPFRHRKPIAKPSIWLRPLPAIGTQPDNTIDSNDESFFVQFFLRDYEDIEQKHYNEFFLNWDVPRTVKTIRFFKKDQLQIVPETVQGQV